MTDAQGDEQTASMHVSVGRRDPAKPAAPWSPLLEGLVSKVFVGHVAGLPAEKALLGMTFRTPEGVDVIVLADPSAAESLAHRILDKLDKAPPPLATRRRPLRRRRLPGTPHHF